MISIDLRSRTPIYEQLNKKISELILKGVLKEHDQLPGVRTLAKELGINPNTVSKAYQELERNKIIYSVSGKGSFISPITESGLKGNVLEGFDAAVLEAISSGISAEELKKRIDEVTAK